MGPIDIFGSWEAFGTLKEKEEGAKPRSPFVSQKFWALRLGPIETLRDLDNLLCTMKTKEE